MDPSTGGATAANRAGANGERSSSSSLADAPRSAGLPVATPRRHMDPSTAGVCHTAGTSSAPARTFMDESDGSDYLDQDSPAGRRDPRRHGIGDGSGDDDMEGIRVQQSACSWNETLARFPGLLQQYPLADSSEFEGGGDGEEELNGNMPEVESGAPDTAALLAQANAGAAAAAAALAETDAAGRTEEVASPSWRSAAASSQSSPVARAAAADLPPTVAAAPMSARAGATPARLNAAPC